MPDELGDAIGNTFDPAMDGAFAKLTNAGGKVESGVNGTISGGR